LETSPALWVGGRIGTQDLDGYRPVEMRIEGPVDHAHSAFTELCFNSVMAKGFFLPAAASWQCASNSPNTVWYNSQGRCSLAYANVDSAGASGTPKCRNFPSQAAKP
jgi:hypothetical protein